MDDCLIVHLGMSGQLLVQPPDAPDERHLHVRIGFTDDDLELRFVDQRTFGGLLLDQLVPSPAGDAVPAAGRPHRPRPARPAFDDGLFLSRLRRRDSAVKRALLDQTLVSGIGNIYADEALWRAKLHGERRGRLLTRADAVRLLGAVREVLGQALTAGGTSFDALYVNVNGQSGYFDRSLAVYGREGEPCPRCGTPDPACRVHEPVELLLPGLPASAAGHRAAACHTYFGLTDAASPSRAKAGIPGISDPSVSIA